MVIEVKNVMELPDNILFLLHEAQRVAANAYNAYSGFYVGAALETTDHQVFLGTFMENASFGLTVCAEISALLAANTQGKLRKVRRIAIVGGSHLDGAGPVVMPCGSCRQVIYEVSLLSGIDTEIYCANANLTSIVVTTIQELLPMAFGKEKIRQTADRQD